MQVVKQEARRFADRELVVDLPGAQGVAPAPEAIRFEVRYRLAEYLALVQGHVAFLLRGGGPAARRRRTLAPLALALASGLGALLPVPGWAGVLLLVVAAMALASLPLAARFWIVLLATPVFYLKRRRMPSCAFRIDAAGIERSSARGRRFWSWEEVRAVRRYRPGYLLMVKEGALPIPLRCLDGRQRRGLRRLIPT